MFNPFSFSMLQQPFNVQGQLNQITDYNPFGMGIPNNSQTAPYVQYNPYQPQQSPYTQWFGNQISNYDPNYYSQLMELMNQTPEQQYLAPFQQTAEDARQAQVAAQNQPAPAPVPDPEPYKMVTRLVHNYGDVPQLVSKTEHDWFAYDNDPNKRKRDWYNRQSG